MASDLKSRSICPTRKPIERSQSLTTIRLIVLARHKEIEARQIVGATRSWIYLSFLSQGVVFGIVGSAISLALIQAIQNFICHQLNGQVKFLSCKFSQLNERES